MTHTTEERYFHEKQAFFIKHGQTGEVKKVTGPMDQYGCYSETVSFSDGAIWFESNGPVWQNVTLEKDGIRIGTDTVKCFRCEYWDTDNAESRYTLSKW